MTDPRSAARLAAVQALYQIERTGQDIEAVIGEYLVHRLGAELDGDLYAEADEVLFADIVRGVQPSLPELDGVISGSLDEGWPLERLTSILRALLRAATYELSVSRDVPVKVIINEYVDMAHAFYGGDEPGFANGVLDTLAKKLRN